MTWLLALAVLAGPATLTTPPRLAGGVGAAAAGFVQPMIAWLDAPRGELARRLDLNHAMQAGSMAVTISATVLQREGASARLVNALRGAER